MTHNNFIHSLEDQNPPPGAGPYLEALWYEHQGDWEKAHGIVQDIHTREASWVHAYLHRVEGDNDNAGYWYHKANKPFSALSLEEEWEEQVKYFSKG